MNNERIIERIKGLLALNNSNATEAEVENAMRLAQAMMEQYAIDMAALQDETKNTDSVERSRLCSELSGNLSTWENMLAWATQNAVPGVNWYRDTAYVQSFDGSGKQKRVSRVYWYGPTDLCEVAKELFEQTRTVISTMAQGLYGGIYKGQGRSYAEGFSHSLQEKTEEQREQTDNRQIESGGKTITAIVIASEKMNKKWLQETLGVRTVKGSSGSGGRHYGNAYNQGQSDGSGYDFKPGKAKSKLSGGRKALT